MATTNSQSGTNAHEVAEGIFRINTPVPPSIIPGGFSFNQFLLVSDEPLLFHTGPRKMFPLVSEAVNFILPKESLRYIAFSHYEADECGSLNEWLADAPHAQPVCGKVAAMVSIDDVADRPAKSMADGEILVIGGHRLRWLDTPIFLTDGRQGISLRKIREHYFAGIYSHNPAAESHRLPKLTYSNQAKPSEKKWITSHIQLMHRVY